MNRTPNDKIQISRSFQAVWCKDRTDECPNPKWHFRGCAREVFSYLELIRSKNNHGGFLFMEVDDIVAHTKDWSKGGKPFTRRQVQRVLKAFRLLGIIGKYETRLIKGRAKSGWQMASHFFWAETKGGQCDFKHWEKFEPCQREVMNNQQDVTANVTLNVTANVTPNVTDLRVNVTPKVTPESDVIAAK